MTQNLTYPAELQPYLDAVQRYVNARSNDVPHGEWEMLSDLNIETVTFRFVDRSRLPFKGVGVWMDAAEVGMKSAQLIGELAGAVFVRLFKEPLPEKEPGALYQTYRA